MRICKTNKYYLLVMKFAMHSILSCNRQNRIIVIVWNLLCSQQILAFNKVQAMAIKLIN